MLLTTVARELATNKLDLVGVQEVRCVKEGTVRARDYNFLKMFFWVFPWRQFVVGRRFGTLYRFHLQRLVVDCGV